MKHFQGTRFVGDIVSPVQLQDINGSTVARCQIGIIEEKKAYNNQPATTHMAKHSIEVWGPNARFLASIPVGHTIMGEGKFQNYKYKAQNGQEQWGTKISVFTFGNCGPSQYAAQNQQQQQPPQQQAPYNNGGQQPPPQNYQPPAQNNNYPPQGGYGAAPNSYPPQQQQQTYQPPQGQQPPVGTDPNEIPF